MLVQEEQGSRRHEVPHDLLLLRILGDRDASMASEMSILREANASALGKTGPRDLEWYLSPLTATPRWVRLPFE
jgi:hypothetical protein